MTVQWCSETSGASSSAMHFAAHYISDNFEYTQARVRGIYLCAAAASKVSSTHIKNITILTKFMSNQQLTSSGTPSAANTQLSLAFPEVAYAVAAPMLMLNKVLICFPVTAPQGLQPTAREGQAMSFSVSHDRCHRQ